VLAAFPYKESSTSSLAV